jgi:hypothetical protein
MLALVTGEIDSNSHYGRFSRNGRRGSRPSIAKNNGWVGFWRVGFHPDRMKGGQNANCCEIEDSLLLKIEYLA